MTHETKFTPGPWLHQGDDEDAGGLPVILIESVESAICEVRANDEGADEDDYVLGEQTNANAHLIAAAPDMYAALEMIADRTSASDDCFLIAMAAMRLARGEAAE
jgi:hypothetical protein